MPSKEMKIIDDTVLYNYYFLWGANQKKCAICLGYGSLYNHDYHPNARYELDLANKTIDFFCIKEIEAGEEITVNYAEGSTASVALHDGSKIYLDKLSKYVSPKKLKQFFHFRISCKSYSSS